MKRFKKTAAVISAFIFASALTGTANADSGEYRTSANETILTWDAEGNPTSGMIEIDLSDTIISTKADHTKYPDGGIWKYGTGINALGNKTCYSKYYHGGVKHSATSKIGSITGRSGIKPSRTWANSSVTGGRGGGAGTCKAYWNTY